MFERDVTALHFSLKTVSEATLIETGPLIRLMLYFRTDIISYTGQAHKRNSIVTLDSNIGDHELM